MTTVSDLLRSLNCEDVIAELGRLYPKTSPAYLDRYRHVWAELLTIKPQPTLLTCELFQMLSDDDEPKPYVAVHGRDIEGNAWAIEYASWGEWVSMEVVVTPDVGDISQSHVLALILTEMTWAGFSNDQIQKKVNGMMESVSASVPDTRWLELGAGK